MKRIVIVNNNMKVGGVQKSLYNLLWSIDLDNQYDVTLLLFSKTGEYLDKLPPRVKIVECGGWFRYLGKSQSECAANPKDALFRGFLAVITRLFGRELAIRLLLMRQPPLPGEYDCAVSYLHNGRRKSFYGGTQDYVLHCVHAKKKIAFLHGDYGKCGADYPENSRMMEKFDAIAACSDGCRQAFENAVPHLTAKCFTVPNCHRFEEIGIMAEDDPHLYDKDVVNAVTVARLSHEKGIDRAIEAAAAAHDRGLPIALHIVGSGPLEADLRQLVKDRALEDHVVFYGEQSNPYKYMKNADLLLLTSYHEAAPMVIDEARFLGIPVLTTETTSSREMVTDRACGWVCENSQKALNEALCRILGDREALNAYKKKQTQTSDNNKALAQFRNLTDI